MKNLGLLLSGKKNTFGKQKLDAFLICSQAEKLIPENIKALEVTPIARSFKNGILTLEVSSSKNLNELKIIGEEIRSKFPQVKSIYFNIKRTV